MIGIDLQNWLSTGHSLAGSFENPLQMTAHIVVSHNQTSGRLGEAAADTHVTHAITQCFFHALDERFLLVVSSAVVIGIFLRIGITVQTLKTGIALGNRLKLVTIEFIERAHHPFIDLVGQQQNFDVFVAEDLRCGLFNAVA